MGSLNGFITNQKQIPLDEGAEARLSLVYFNDKHRYILKDKPLFEVRTLEPSDYQPQGGTALFDAIGSVITAQQSKAGSTIVVILTDGEDNASREYKRETIMTMIREMESKHGWQFVYIGANQDAFASASAMGILQSQNYVQNSTGVRDVFVQVDQSMQTFRKCAAKGKSKAVFKL